MSEERRRRNSEVCSLTAGCAQRVPAGYQDDRLVRNLDCKCRRASFPALLPPQPVEEEVRRASMTAFFPQQPSLCCEMEKSEEKTVLVRPRRISRPFWILSNYPFKYYEWLWDFAPIVPRFIGRLTGRRRRRPLNFPPTPWGKMTTSFLYLIIVIVTLCLQLDVADGCSSRSTPKPRPPSPTLRPNITIQTYTCPPEYDAHYCLNGATCFTVKIGESILYNCECAEGYMGQRCEFKDLDGSYLREIVRADDKESESKKKWNFSQKIYFDGSFYSSAPRISALLASKQRAMLEQAGFTSGAVIIILLVVVLSFYLYVRSRRRLDLKKKEMETPVGLDAVDFASFQAQQQQRRPFSVDYSILNQSSTFRPISQNPRDSRFDLPAVHGTWNHGSVDSSRSRKVSLVEADPGPSLP